MGQQRSRAHFFNTEGGIGVFHSVCIDIHILMHLVEVERTHLFWYRFGIVLEIVLGGPFWK